MSRKRSDAVGLSELLHAQLIRDGDEVITFCKETAAVVRATVLAGGTLRAHLTHAVYKDPVDWINSEAPEFYHKQGYYKQILHKRSRRTLAQLGQELRSRNSQQQDGVAHSGVSELAPLPPMAAAAAAAAAVTPGAAGSVVVVPTMVARSPPSPPQQQQQQQQPQQQQPQQQQQQPQQPQPKKKRTREQEPQRPRPRTAPAATAPRPTQDAGAGEVPPLPSQAALQAWRRFSKVADVALVHFAAMEPQGQSSEGLVDIRTAMDALDAALERQVRRYHEQLRESIM